MTKKEQFERAMEICKAHKLPEKVVAEIKELLEPKKGGQSINVDEIVKRDANGNVVEMLCRASNVWLPADTLNFFPDKNSKVINKDGEGLYTGISRVADKIKKETAKAYKASKEAIMNDVLEGVITPEEGKAKLDSIPTEPDYSTVAPVLPTEDAE